MRRSLRRSLVVLALAFGAVSSATFAPLPVVRAEDDDEKAVDELKTITEWLSGQEPKDADEKKKLRATLTSKLKAFLKSYPSAGHTTLTAKYILADVYGQEKNFDGALALCDDLAKSKDEKYAPWAKVECVRLLMQKRDYAQARVKLDALKKEMAGDERVTKLDELLRQSEGGKAASQTMKAGGAPPALKAKSLAGADVDLGELKGKVVLVDFWATWCPPCKAELPNLKKVYAELHSKGFEILGVDGLERDPTSAKLKDYLAKEQIAWPQVVEDGKRISREWGVQALPRLVLIDKSGQIAAIDLTGDRLAKAVRALVADKPIPPEVLDPPAKEGEGDDAGEK